jgi:hypothetical protein
LCFYCRVSDPVPTVETPVEAPPGYPPLPPGYVWAYPPPPPQPEPSWRAPRWLKYVSVGWVVVLVGLALFYSFRGRPTVREQTSISQAQPTVDTAIRDVVAAAGPAPIIAISDYHKVSSCKITAARGGAEYQRTVDLFTTPGTESAVLHAIGAGLPKSYGAEVGNDTKLSLYADAGNFVAVAGSVPTPGEVEVRALTGCRADDGRPAAAVVAPPGSPAANALAQAFGAIGAPDPTPATGATVACATGDPLRTVAEQVPAGTTVGRLDTALAKLGATPVISTQMLAAYRVDAVDVVIRVRGGTVVVTATTRCGQ